MSGFSPENLPSKPSANPGRRFALVDTLCRYLLAAVFLMAGSTKLLDLTSFSNLIVFHSRLPIPVARAVGLLVPWLELTCGFCLLLNVARREAAVLVGVLLIVFASYVWTLPDGADCGCALFPKKLPALASRGWLVCRNLLLLVCAVRVAWRSDGGSTVAPTVASMSVQHPTEEKR